MGVIVEDGMRIDTVTGILLGPNLVPDTYNVDSAPLYIYNRSIRFYALCRRSMPGPVSQVNRVIHLFTRLEDSWADRKEKYKPRKYFLSQKLLCKELCRHCDFECTIEKAIHDKARLRAQMVIYDDLFDTIKTKEWPREYISDNKRSNISSGQVQNCHLPVVKLPLTRSETIDQLMILAHQCRLVSV